MSDKFKRKKITTNESLAFIVMFYRPLKIHHTRITGRLSRAGYYIRFLLVNNLVLTSEAEIKVQNTGETHECITRYIYILNFITLGVLFLAKKSLICIW